MGVKYKNDPLRHSRGRCLFRIRWGRLFPNNYGLGDNGVGKIKIRVRIFLKNFPQTRFKHAYHNYEKTEIEVRNKIDKQIIFQVFHKSHKTIFMKFTFYIFQIF